ncbi:DUF397 domain-containing protein [Yinghuangia sp. YIM S09857]|uniref:DUF397 domain-containing protein n=1 Tax=Yinghuangia sp. YIM S09857 TaxID=3436929 RepID=UPI003F53AF99
MGHGVAWRRSSYSGVDHQCVEATASRAWHRSSHSGANGDCVEAVSAPPATLVRDSKRPASAHLRFSASSWRSFLERRATTA